MKTLAAKVTVVLVGCASVCALAAPSAAAVDIYAFANGCYALRDANTDRFVVRDALGYAATSPTATTATPFRMQATALGSYLLYGPDKRMPGAGALGAVSPIATPGPSADWRVSDSGETVRLESVSSGKELGVEALGRLVQVASTDPRWSLVAADGCADFPEVEVNVTGKPFKGPAKGRVRGFVDDHIHLGAFRFLSGGFHCGRPWSPYGVTVALRDCADHYPNGEGAVVENFFNTGTPAGSHSPEGWPSFAGWPRDESMTHEGTYWKWIERAWRSGLRIMVNDLVENRALCDLYPLKQDPNCNEMDSAYEQAEDMLALQDYIDAQFGGPGKGFLRIVKTPAEARKVISAGKLAMVLGVEISEVLNCGQFMDQPRCTTDQIDAELDRLQSIGVVSLFPIHKFDNALGGVKFDSGATGVLVNTGNKYATGKFWTAEHCDDPDHDNEPTNPTGEHAETFYTLFGPVLVQPLFQGQLPIYPQAPLCNPRGLTPLGEYVIRSMMRRGMIVETDHMSMRARRQTLDLLEGNDNYPGVISSHSWGDPGSQKRLQRLGGLVGPISSQAHHFAEEWREARANRDSRFLFGLGFGSDINGLHAQPVPRSDAAQNPVRYPFRSFDGGSVIDRQRSGTRTWDINTDGVDHYGLYADWVEDLRLVAGQQIVDDLANGAESYLQLWERAVAAGNG